MYDSFRVLDAILVLCWSRLLLSTLLCVYAGGIPLLCIYSPPLASGCIITGVILRPVILFRLSTRWLRGRGLAIPNGPLDFSSSPAPLLARASEYFVLPHGITRETQSSGGR